MRAVDTNVLVRLLTRDDAKQAAAGEQFIVKGAWVSILALAETTWILSALYGRDAAGVATAVDMLLEHASLTLENADVVSAALSHFRNRPALGFSDCLMLELARKAGHLPLGTFDRTLARMTGAVRV